MREHSQVESGGWQAQDLSILREQAYADDAHVYVRYRTHPLNILVPVGFWWWALDLEAVQFEAEEIIRREVHLDRTKITGAIEGVKGN